MVLTRSMVRERKGKGKTSATDALVPRSTQFKGIHVGTLNIVDGRQNRLKLACHELRRHGVDIAIITETKLNGYHTVLSYGYSIVARRIANEHQGGVALAVRESGNWHVESSCTFGENIVRSILVHDERRTTIIGIYIPPSKMDMKQ